MNEIDYASLLTHFEKQGAKLDDILTLTHGIDKRVAILESKSYDLLVKEVNNRLAENDRKISSIEEALSVWKAKVYTVLAAIGVFWTVLVSALKHWLGLING